MDDTSPYPQAPFLIPPLPEKVTATTTHPEPDITTSKLAPEQKKLFGDLETLRDQQIDDAVAASDHAKEVAETKAADERAQADELARQEAERAKAYSQTQDEISQWSTRLKEARDKYDNAPTPSLFHDGDTYGNVMKALAVGLSGAADVMRARIAVMTGRDQGPSAVDDIINRDLDRQREQIKMMSNRVAMAKAGLDDAQEARKLLMAEVDARGAMAFKRVVAIGKANLEAQGKTQADIDANTTIANAQKQMLDAEGRAVDGMTQKIVNQGKDVTITENENKADKSKSTTPQGYTDTYSGKTLPVDPALTEQRAYGTAVKQLPQVNAAIQTVDKLIVGGEKNGPDLPEWLSKIGADTHRQAEFKADVIKFRNAYGIAKGGESQAIPSKEELEQAIPNPPSSWSSKETWDNYMAKLRSARDDVMNVRKGYLANLGVHLDAIDEASTPRHQGHALASHGAAQAPVQPMPDAGPRDIVPPVGPAPSPTAAPGSKDSPEDVNSSAALPEDPNAQSIDDFQPKAPKRSPGVAGLKSIPTPTPAQPSAPATPAANPLADLRARTIQKLKANPNLPGAKIVMKQLGITDEDLR